MATFYEHGYRNDEINYHEVPHLDVLTWRYRL